MFHAQRAVIIYGPPGSGKGTQAELLVRNFGFIHFDTGRYIENLLRMPGVSKNPILSREKKLFNAGMLCTPSWVLQIVKYAAERIAKSGYSIVFSGSPRTIYEAFGDKKQSGLLQTLTKHFGKKNITIIQLQVRDASSLTRNSHRLLCSVCGLPIIAGSNVNACAFCAGATRRRVLDDPKVIKVRLIEYRNRTYPIVARARKEGLHIYPISGEPLPYKVHERVVKTLRLP